MKVEETGRLRPPVFWAVLGGYIVLVAGLGFFHEMWRDEVRALSVATGSPSWGVLLSQLKFEGHPILWYAVLRIAFALTHSNLVLPGAAGLIAFAAAYVILRYAPFPMWLRLLSIFGAFLGYELSVSARNYGLGVLLTMTSCLAFRRRRERPVLLGMSLFLLANTSIHAAMAALVIMLYWTFDLRERRSEALSVKSIAAFAIATAGVAFAIFVARPAPDMAWSVSLSTLDYSRVLASIFSDPGKGLIGYQATSITAISELPWRFLGIDPAILSRVIVDLCIAWLLFCLRRHPRALMAIVITIIGFEIFFRTIYTAGLRHEGIVLFLIFAICWLEIQRVGDSRRIALGLLPIFVIQSLALPFLAQRTIRHRESSAKAFAAFIKSHPRYQNAILMSEPDYLMESMPYYVKNPMFMPRQNELTNRVYFGGPNRRRASMTLRDLRGIAERVSCTAQAPVLVAIGYSDFPYKSIGVGHPLYRGLTFTWSAPDWFLLGGPHPVASFPRAVSDEIYRIYEVYGCK